MSEWKCHASEQSRSIEDAFTGHLVTKKSRCSASDGPGHVRLKDAAGSTASWSSRSRVPVWRPGLCSLPTRKPDLGKACWKTGTHRVHSRSKVKRGGQPVRSAAGEAQLKSQGCSLGFILNPSAFFLTLFFNLPRACDSVDLIFEILEVVCPGQFISCHKTSL